MAESIVAGMFGLTPDLVRQQGIEGDRQRAYQFSQMDPQQQANYGIGVSASGLVRAAAPMLGLIDPQQQQAQQQQNVQQQIDHSTPEGLMKGAQLFNQAGNARMAYMYQQAADAKQKELAGLALTRAQEQKALADASKAGREENMAKYGRLQKMEIGVEGKPDYRQQALYDPLTGEIKNIGAPYRVPAAITADSRQSTLSAKDAAKEESVAAGKEKVNLQVTTLKDYYDQLLKGGGIVSTADKAGSNIAARIGSTSVGQMAGGAIGTENQKFRDQIKQSRPLLLQAIKKATGMTGKEMDSNVELKMYLAAATDPEIGYEANIEALSNLDKLFGLGVGFDTKKSAQQAKPAAQSGGWAIRPK